MARYIRADKALDLFHKAYKEMEVISLVRGNGASPLFSMNDIEILIQAIPTADVAEIVHCKDCKHFNPNEPCVGGTYEACTALSGVDGCGMNVEEDFFCAYGEKL